MELKIISPKGVVCSAVVESVSLPGAAGRFTVLKNHAPLVSSLASGNIQFNEDGLIRTVNVKGGFVHVCNNVIEISVETNDNIQ